MNTDFHSVLTGLHYACGASVVTVALLAIIFTKTASSTATAHRSAKRTQRNVYSSKALQALAIATYISEIIVVSLQDNDFGQSQPCLVHLFLAAVTLSTLVSIRSTTSMPLIIASGTLISLEVPLIVLHGLHYRWSASEITIFVTEIVRILSLVVAVLLALPKYLHRPASVDEDTQPLLQGQDQDQDQADSHYGGTANADSGKPNADDDSDDENEDEATKKIKQRRAELLKDRGGWLGYLKDFKIFTPYIVPKHDRLVQFCYLVCVLGLIAGRALNVMVPAQLGKVADNLSQGKPPYHALIIWLLLSLARYSPGLDFIETLAKIPIENFSYRGLTNAAFSHVMSLSMDFHSERDSAEVIRAIEQGHAITTLLSTLVLDIVPTLLDLMIALVYLSHKFNYWVAIALLAATIFFTAAEAIATSWNLNNRRMMAKASRQEAKVILQAVQGWQTVWYFNMFGYERHRFGQAIQDHLAARQAWSIGTSFIQAIVESLFPATFFVLACLVAHEISVGRASPGDFVFLMQYWENLTWPIAMLSHNCRFFMSDLVDAERLLHLFQSKPSIVTGENAVDIKVEGNINFENVEFSYQSKQTILHDLSLSVASGQTIALVGETGAGKSSIMKLLLRLYEVTSGRITIDGRDIRDITLDALRTAIGVVPQAPLLFNGSIVENLRYAKLDATEAEIHAACQAAAIHDKITTFADGYETRVGEQGVKLSGGEIQRLAIARVFLKDPPILILDEATSAVDSLTEAAVQTALDRLRNSRTTLVIAHRLSTIVKADQILVIHDGRIEEQGRHGELLEHGGRYHRMWTAQTTAHGKPNEKDDAAENK